MIAGVSQAPDRARSAASSGSPASSACWPSFLGCGCPKPRGGRWKRSPIPGRRHPGSDCGPRVCLAAAPPLPGVFPQPATPPSGDIKNPLGQRQDFPDAFFAVDLLAFFLGWAGRPALRRVETQDRVHGAPQVFPKPANIVAKASLLGGLLLLAGLLWGGLSTRGPRTERAWRTPWCNPSRSATSIMRAFWASIAGIATPRWNTPPSPAFRPRRPA